METPKERWINTVTQSAKEVRSLPVPGTLFDSILSAIGEPDHGKEAIIPFHRFRFAMIAASLLILLNISVLSFYLANKKNRPNVSEHPQYMEPYNLDLY